MHNRQFACKGIHSKLSKLSINFIISLESFLVSASFAESFLFVLVRFPSWIRARNEMESKFCGFIKVNLKSGRSWSEQFKIQKKFFLFSSRNCLRYKWTLTKTFVVNFIPNLTNFYGENFDSSSCPGSAWTFSTIIKQTFATFFQSSQWVSGEIIKCVLLMGN